MIFFFSPLLFDHGRVRQTGGSNEQASICQDISHGLFVIPSCLSGPLAVSPVLGYRANIDASNSVSSLVDKISGMELIIRQQPTKIPKELGCGIEGFIILQDAIGRKIRVPFVVCATLDMFHGFLELVFRCLPGYQKVLSREYSISDGKSQKEITSTEWVNNITPGRLVSMSVLFRHMGNALGATDFKNKCPRCKTPGTFSASGGSHVWTQW